MAPIGITTSDTSWLVYVLRPEVIPIVGAFTVGAIAIIATSWRKVVNHRADVELKRDMVARGMSAEEIERVLRAGPPQRHS